ncbi:uncharacterized protein TEOVI_000404300 [Trypanosoma equiperdum]|uniref:Uncharacterized protein n=4 Tax=Trypanozoon TaxID=39700 RepID=Q38E19_TRYB2|nr:hypothetical protein, conserved [Trypanosoma brucei gambiense DAL972]XP_827281.1 hypothetical protein, conserved [Trypanosoma brucei brucei TREU927]RHW70126.1 hypothetical protein DPX39_090054700 [Trypanosoma brucei equiperdum]SCU72466.1 hypothetical protein, conserved [Trypanosoma equiperdum]EAN76951.1 hypothetical protein, conserved [Trypanosoma brucei brucei TREU927]CBH14488.1 hypothetical protein, conserved [Trypanosoma brucei gambiense DAL972]|eukprot:XP_011776754.1 hypothetical protein, conserved [Trypanosoma brucei gambiense DAL972]
MSLQTTLIQSIKEVNPCIVLFASVVQVAFAALWYKLIVKTIVDYHLAADKGVRRVEHILQRYPPYVHWIVTLLSACFRIVFIATIVGICKGNSLHDYQNAALLVAGISCVSQHLSIQHQRPLPLLAADVGYEVIAALLASLTYYAIMTVNVF